MCAAVAGLQTLAINLKRTGGVDFPCVTCVGARVGLGTLHDLTETLPACGVDPTVLSRLQLLPVLTHRDKDRGMLHEFQTFCNKPKNTQEY